MNENVVGTPVTIVRADEVAFDSFTSLHELLMQAFAYMDDRIDPPSSMRRLTVEGLREKAQRESLLLAFKDQLLIGCVFVTAKAEALYIGKLAVSEACRGLGVGQKLLAKAEEMARCDGFGLLELEVRVELIENHRFFEQHGFTKFSENAHSGYNRPTSFVYRKLIV